MQDRQQLLDSVVEDLRELDIPASWRKSKRVYDQWARWRGFVKELQAHRSSTGSLPQSGEAASWLVRMRWRKRSLKLKDLLWLDAQVPGWDTDENVLRARRVAQGSSVEGGNARAAEMGCNDESGDVRLGRD